MTGVFATSPSDAGAYAGGRQSVAQTAAILQRTLARREAESAPAATSGVISSIIGRHASTSLRSTPVPVAVASLDGSCYQQASSVAPVPGVGSETNPGTALPDIDYGQGPCRRHTAGRCGRYRLQLAVAHRSRYPSMSSPRSRSLLYRSSAPADLVWAADRSTSHTPLHDPLWHHISHRPVSRFPKIEHY